MGRTTRTTTLPPAPAGRCRCSRYDAVGDPIDVVVTRRSHSADGVGDRTGSRLRPTADGVRVGDTITLTGPVGTIQLTVSGLAFVPAGPHNSYSSGGWILPAAFDTLFDGFRFHFGLASTVPGADSQAGHRPIGGRRRDGRARSRSSLRPNATSSASCRRFRCCSPDSWPCSGLGAIAHTLTSTARRRRHDFAMLRALGMRPRDTTAVVFVQAAVIAIASLASVCRRGSWSGGPCGGGWRSIRPCSSSCRMRGRRWRSCARS